MIPRRAFLQYSLATLASTASASAGTPIRIAQIGTQHSHASGKMASLRGLPDHYEVVALADLEDSDDLIYKDLPRLKVAELLALPGLQAVTVETRLEDACALALQAIRAGKHVHLDKPGAVAHAEFKTMRNAADQRDVIVQMGYMLRHNPAFQLLFKASREGWLGQITEIDAMMGKWADPGTRKKIGALAGGGMFELGCHMIDAVITLLGKPQAVHAFSTPSQAEDRVLDNQLAVLEYPKTSVTLRCNHVDPFGGPRRRFQVTGTKGSIEIMPMESGRLVARFDSAHGEFKQGEQAVNLPVSKDRYQEEFLFLAKCLRKESTFPWDAAHDILVHETVLRASGMAIR